MAAYIALMEKEAGADYGVFFPDFPGCVTAGTTLEQAKDWAREALELHIQGMLEDGEALPAPSSLDAIMRDPLAEKAVAFLVEVSPQPRKIRVNIMLPQDLLSQIDAHAKKKGMNRSSFLAAAADTALKAEEGR